RCDELLAVRGRQEAAALLVVTEELDRSEREPSRLEHAACLPSCRLEVVQPMCDVRVVLEVPGALGDAVSPRAMQAPAVGERPDQEAGELLCRVEALAAV